MVSKTTLDGGGLKTARGEPLVIDLVKHQPPDAKWEDGFRPVDVAFDECGRLLVVATV